MTCYLDCQERPRDIYGCLTVHCFIVQTNDKIIK